MKRVPSARGLSRSKRKRPTRADRSFAHPSAALIEAGFALGRDHRDDDAALAPARQKRRGRAGLALGCLLICALGGADADQGLRLAPDGSLLGRERRGAGVHWASARCQGADARPLQHRPGVCGARQGGGREVNHWVVKEAHRFGFVDDGSLSADTTAQELPIGYPNEPGILRGLAQRCGRALTQLKKRGVQGLSGALDQVQTILCSVKEHHLFTSGQAAKRQVLTRILTEVGALMVQTRPLIERLGTRLERVIQSARSRLMAMHEVIKPLMRQIVHWLSTGKVAPNKIVHVGIPQARAIVRNKSGKKTAFGLAYLIGRLGGGYLFGRRIAANADEKQMPLQALAAYRAIFGQTATPELVVYDRGGDSTLTRQRLALEGVKEVGIQPKGHRPWSVAEGVRDQIRSERVGPREAWGR